MRAWSRACLSRVQAMRASWNDSGLCFTHSEKQLHDWTCGLEKSLWLLCVLTHALEYMCASLLTPFPDPRLHRKVP